MPSFLLLCGADLLHPFIRTSTARRTHSSFVPYLPLSSTTGIWHWYWYWCTSYFTFAFGHSPFSRLHPTKIRPEQNPAQNMNANQSQSEESRRTREVRFDDSPEELSVEYPSFETDDVWYSWGEVRSMIAAQHADVLRISNALAMAPAAHVTNDQRIEMRGLEAFISPVVAQMIIQNRNAHLNAVFNEQGRQVLLNINEATVLCRISERHSRPSRKTAYQLALRFSDMS